MHWSVKVVVSFRSFFKNSFAFPRWKGFFKNQNHIFSHNPALRTIFQNRGRGPKTVLRISRIHPFWRRQFSLLAFWSVLSFNWLFNFKTVQCTLKKKRCLGESSCLSDHCYHWIGNRDHWTLKVIHCKKEAMPDRKNILALSDQWHSWDLVLWRKPWLEENFHQLGQWPLLRFLKVKQCKHGGDSQLAGILRKCQLYNHVLSQFSIQENETTRWAEFRI